MAGLFALAPVEGGEPLSAERAASIGSALPALDSADGAVREAFRIALSDVVSNIQPYVGGLNDEPVPVLLAGQRYPTPWTRDSAITMCGMAFP